MEADARFRALATAVVPEAAALSDQGWREVVAIIDTALADRPAALRRQLGLLIGLLTWLPLFRWGRPFGSLPAELRARFLAAIQDAPLLLLRRGFWGFRTLVFMGYYGRPEAAAALGYRADVRGWEARR